MLVDTWKRFQGLGASETTIVATVSAHNPDGTSTLVTPEGYPLRALGSAVAVGMKAYVRGGRVVDQAADLPTLNLTV
jgi:hypothetical protein